MLLTCDIIHEHEEDPTFGSTIQPLLKKLDVPDALGEVLDFLVGFGPLFEQISFNLFKKFVAKRKLQSKEENQSHAWSSDYKSKYRLEELAGELE